MKLVAVIAIAVSALTACGGGGGSDSKDLFSLWTRDGDNSSLELSGGALNTPLLVSTFDQDGSQCNCTMRFIGTQESGSLTINACYFVTSPVKDPGCSKRGGSGTYSKSASILTLVGPTGTSSKFR